MNPTCWVCEGWPDSCRCPDHAGWVRVTAADLPRFKGARVALSQQDANDPQRVPDRVTYAVAIDNAVELATRDGRVVLTADHPAWIHPDDHTPTHPVIETPSGDQFALF